MRIYESSRIYLLVVILMIVEAPVFASDYLNDSWMDNEPTPSPVQPLHSEPPSVVISDEVRGKQGSVDLQIEFLCTDNTRSVDMDSLEVRYMNMMGMDITDKVRPFIRQNKIIAHNLELPKGEHIIEIKIRDNQNIETIRAITFQVH